MSGHVIRCQSLCKDDLVHAGLSRHLGLCVLEEGHSFVQVNHVDQGLVLHDVCIWGLEVGIGAAWATDWPFTGF